MIILFEQELPHYRVPVFSALADRLGEELIVCHGRPPASADFISARHETLSFQHFELRTWLMGDGKLYGQDFLAAARRYPAPRAIIVRHSIRNLSLLPLLWFYKRQGVPVVIWGQGYSRHRPFRPQRNLYDRIHLYISRLADAYVCYTQDIYSELSAYLPAEKLFVATNTLDTRLLSNIRGRLLVEGKANVKQRLGLERQYYLVFIGRLHPRKKVPYLLDVYGLLKKEYGLDVGLLVIGKGDQEAFAQQIDEAGLTDIHFLGPLSDEEAGKYLFAADLMVMPGWLGLAVNHAFVFGLPVVSQRSGDNLYQHGPEAAYVQHGVTGWFSKLDDQRAMADGICSLMESLPVYSANVLQYAEKYLKIEAMTANFAAAVAYAMGTTCKEQRVPRRS